MDLDVSTLGSMSNTTVTLSAEFGIAPEGAEIDSWDWAEDEDGYRRRYEFLMIPEEAVTVTNPWADRSDGIPGIRARLNNVTDPIWVVRLTVSRGTSFMATCWTRFAEAGQMLTKFLAETAC